MKAISPLMTPDCETCPNRKFSDICDIVPSVEESGGLIKRRAMYQPGQYVFYEGHVALGLYILCHGRIKLTRLNRKGQQRLVGILDSGQLLCRSQTCAFSRSIPGGLRAVGWGCVAVHQKLAYFGPRWRIVTGNNFPADMLKL